MPDITEIAAACANRIMDRMEMCRGSAILKSDIEREVEMAVRIALRDLSESYAVPDDAADESKGFPELGPWFDEAAEITDAALKSLKRNDASKGRPYPGWIDPKCVITPKQAEERGIPMGAAGYIWVDDVEPGTIIANDDGETSRIWNGVNWVDDARVDAAKTTIIGKPYSVLQAEKEFHEAYERTKQYLTVNTVDLPATGILGEAHKALEDYRASRPADAPMTATEVELDRAAARERYVDPPLIAVLNKEDLPKPQPGAIQFVRHETPIWKEALDVVHLTPLGFDAADTKLKIIKAIARKHAESQNDANS
jgi:hypothetical protein